MGVEKNDLACVYLNGVDKYASIKMNFKRENWVHSNKSYILNFVYTARAFDPVKIVDVMKNLCTCFSWEVLVYSDEQDGLIQWVRLLTQLWKTWNQFLWRAGFIRPCPYLVICQTGPDKPQGTDWPALQVPSSMTLSPLFRVSAVSNVTSIWLL